MREYFEDIIKALPAKKARLTELGDLLEYPEIQADKKYLLSVLDEYHALVSRVETMQRISDIVDEYVALNDHKANSDAEREMFEEERAILLSDAYRLRATLFDADDDTDRVIYRITSDEPSYPAAEKLYNVLLPHLTLSAEPKIYRKTDDGKIIETELSGKGAFFVASAIWGTHKVLFPNNKTGRFTVTAVKKEEIPTYKEDDFKVTVFHSSGAGGQNINKLDTAVRVTYIPTGKTVVCQDERSQLSNKNRALDTIKKRLIADFIKERDERYEILRKSQKQTDGAIVYDAVNNTVTVRKATYKLTSEYAERIILDLCGEVKI